MSPFWETIRPRCCPSFGPGVPVRRTTAIITYDVKWNPLDLAYHRVHSLCRSFQSVWKRRFGNRRSRHYQSDLLPGLCPGGHVTDPGPTLPFVLRVTPIPDLTEGVSFMQSAEGAALALFADAGKIVELALARTRKSAARNGRRGRLRTRLVNLITQEDSNARREANNRSIPFENHEIHGAAGGHTAIR